MGGCARRGGSASQRALRASLQQHAGAHLHCGGVKFLPPDWWRRQLSLNGIKWKSEELSGIKSRNTPYSQGISVGIRILQFSRRSTFVFLHHCQRSLIKNLILHGLVVELLQQDMCVFIARVMTLAVLRATSGRESDWRLQWHLSTD